MSPVKYFINSLEDYNGQIDYPKEEQKVNVIRLVNGIIAYYKYNEWNEGKGIYTGIAGASYLMYHLSKLPALESESSKESYLKLAMQFLELPIDNIPDVLSSDSLTRKTGFMTGLVGTYALAIVLHNKLGNESELRKYIESFEKVAEIITPIDWNEGGGDELFVGRAGYLCALLWIRREIKSEVIPDKTVFKLLDAIIVSGKKQAKAIRSSFPLLFHYHEKFYFGPAHGLSGILLILLRFPDWLKTRPASEVLIRESINELLKQQTPTGNFPSSLGRVRADDDELTHWCHGAPGVVHLLAKAYMVYGDEIYLNAALRCGDVTWRKGLIKKGPGLCHGLSSSGYTFLVLYKITDDKLHLHRAISVMSFYYNPVFECANTPDCPFSLYEGLSGFACFSADLLDPKEWEFPFFTLD